MANMGGLEADDIGAEFRQLQPQRHLTLEHPAFAPFVARACAFAGDDKGKSDALVLRPAQESKQHRVCLVLRTAVEVDARLDRLASARKPLLEPPVERLEPRRRLRRRRFDP